MKYLLLIYIFILSTPSHAKFETCQQAMTVDEKYQALVDSSATAKDKTSEITHLLSEAFTPYLVGLYYNIAQLKPFEIRAVAERFQSKIVIPSRAKINSSTGGMGFTNTFVGLVRYENEQDANSYGGPFTHFNGEVMRKFSLAANVMEYIVRAKFHPSEDQTVAESLRLRCKHTYPEDNLNQMLYFSLVSTVQAAGHLTVEPVGNLDAEKMLKAVMSQKDRMPSPVVLYSLMLPPKLLGQFGNKVYVAAPLQQKNDRLVFTEHFKKFLKVHRDRFLKQNYSRPYELGHGCPVGHNVQGEERPGLQYFLDAMMHIYGALE